MTVNTKFYAKDAGWTKQQMWDNGLEDILGDDYSPEDITDRDIQYFVNQDFNYRDEFPDEEDYVEARGDLFQTIANWITAR
jgi:hypothetical protein